MADDVNPALRAELEAAKAAIEPQLRGLNDLMAVSISVDLRAEIARQIEIRNRRRTKLQAVLSDLDKIQEDLDLLEKDGYPEIEGSTLSAPLLSELQGEESDLDAAVSIFVPEVAETLAVNLGSPSSKPKG